MSERAALFVVLVALGLANPGCTSPARFPAPKVRLEGDLLFATPYVGRMTTKVHRKWEHLLRAGKIQPPAGGSVEVTFALDASGVVSRIVRVEEHSTELAMRACVGAITDSAPFSPWTDEMKMAFGHEKVLTFTFNFE